MKLLHFTDLHLGIESYGTLNPKTGLSTRVDDFLRSLDEVVDYAISEPVDAVLFAGDAFKNRDPNPTIQRFFAQRIRRLSTAGIPTVLLIGNHDLPNNTARATAIDIYEALEIPCVTVGRRIDCVRIETASGPLQVVTLPWISRSQLMTNEDMRQLSPDQIQMRMAEEISNALRALTGELDRAVPAVLLAHTSVEGAKLGSEQSIMLGQELVLGLDNLHVQSFDYVALGHIHGYQVVHDQPPVVYAGSIERIDFGEEHEEKGFVTVEITTDADGRRVAAPSFHPVHARPFHTLRIPAVSDDPMDDVRRTIERRAADISGAIVRAFIKLPAEREDHVRLSEVRQLLLDAGAAYVGKVSTEVETQARRQVEIDADEALDPVKMLERWLGQLDMAPERRARILEEGKAIIRETGSTRTE